MAKPYALAAGSTSVDKASSTWSSTPGKAATPAAGRAHLLPAPLCLPLVPFSLIQLLPFSAPMPGVPIFSLTPFPAICAVTLSTG